MQLCNLITEISAYENGRPKQKHSDRRKRAKSTSRRNWREEMVAKVADSS